MKPQFTERVLDKLRVKHGVTPEEVCQCFENRTGRFLEDNRDEHETDPPTQWFISETNRCRTLKVAFIQRQYRGVVRIDVRTAYPPNENEIRIYERLALS